MMRRLSIVLFITTLAFAGCGGEKVACVGTVTKTYTEYEAGPGINSGSVNIPSGSTKYAIAIKRSDGSYCSRRIKKQDWLAIEVGATYG